MRTEIKYFYWYTVAHVITINFKKSTLNKIILLIRIFPITTTLRSSF